jgi:hypothetical protein
MKEEEIRPVAVFDEYLKLCRNDTQKYFASGDRLSICCPACGEKGIYSFTKQGFIYEECPVCQTLFVNPRPLAEAFSLYYLESDSVKYWASTFYNVTAEARREKLWKPKSKLVYELLSRFGSQQFDLFDIGGGYGIFAEEYELLTGQKVTIIEPGSDLARICRGKGLRVVEDFLENIKSSELPSGHKAFVSFELFEHLHDPEKFLVHLLNLMGKGDLFCFTTLSGAGVDIQALWEDSKSVSPPHHLNFFNPKSVKILLDRIGLSVLSVTTPGKLDIDILCNNSQFIKDRFWRVFSSQANEDDKQAMQSFIAEHGWSSHMMVVCKKI